MEMLIIADENVKITLTREEFKSLCGDSIISIIKGAPLFKELHKLLQSEEIPFRVYKFEGRVSLGNIRDRVRQTEKVLLLSNIGEVTTTVALFDNILTYLDSPPKLTSFPIDFDSSIIDLNAANIFNITDTKSPFKVAEAMQGFTKGKLLKTIYNTELHFKGKKEDSVNIVKAFYSYGILIRDKEGKIGLPTTKDIAETLNRHPFERAVLEDNIPNELAYTLRDITSPTPGVFKVLQSESEEMKKGITLLKKHRSNKILLLTDSDTDGLTSATIGHLYLDLMLDLNVKVFNTEREFGNGVSEEMVKLILREKPSLIITADMGSSDEERYKVIKENGIDIIVTDHHTLHPTGRPKSADSFINCMDDYSGLPNYISGCTVLYSFFYNYSRSNGSEDILDKLLPYVSISIIGDMMRLDKGINRYLYKLGASLIEQSIPWVEALNLETVNMDTLSFRVINLINATNRMGKAKAGFDFLTSKNTIVAEKRLKYVNRLDREKRKIVKETLSKSDITNNGNLTTCIANTKYDGILGLMASRLIKDNVTLAISDIGGNYKGSMRTNANNIDLAGMLHSLGPLLDRSGGHKGAAGLGFKKENLDKVKKGIEEGIKDATFKDVEGFPIPIKILTSEGLFKLYKSLEPYGEGFSKPVFTVSGVVVSYSFKGIGKIGIKDSDGNVVFIKTFRKREFTIGENVSINVVIRHIKNKEIWEDS